jgi:uncharacterized protein (TIGR00251 family)
MNNNTSILAVKVIPNAPKNSLLGWEEDRLRVKIQAVPDQGKANAALIDYLASLLNIPKSNISLLSGKTSRLKRLAIVGISQDELRKKLEGMSD